MKTRLVHFLTGVLAAGALAFTGSANAQNGNCCNNDCCDFDGSVYAELLIWDTCQDLRYATSGSTTNLFLDSDWDLGFRVGAMVAASDDWDLGVDFTYFNSSAKASSTASVTSVLASTALTDYSIRTELDYMILDALVSRKCCVCEKMVLRPYGGFRAFWTKQDIRETGDDGVNDHTSTADYDMDAYGLMAGVEFEWCAFGPLTLVLKSETSLLNGSLDATTNLDQEGANTTETSKSDCRAVFGPTNSVGLDYEDSMCDWEYGIRLSYEISNWIHVDNPLDDNNDLGVHGFNVQFRVQF
ncbi:MAG: hypothetical protein KDK78_08735 [Chlamydiia bacterium]|nr:hypothetical protein [Chlamydiia bacterium]